VVNDEVMDTPPEPPPEEVPPARDDEAPVAVRPRVVEETASDHPPVVEMPPRVIEQTASDHPPVAEAPREEAPAPKRRWLRALVALVGVLLAAAVALVLIAPVYIRDRIHEEARARGMVLVFRDVDVGLSRVVLGGVKISLVGVPDLEAQAERIEVDHTDWEPKAVRARGLSISMLGTAVLEHLATWKAANPRALAAPIEGEGATVEWHPVKGADTALSFGNARVSVSDDEGSVAAGEVVFNGRSAGPVQLSWLSEGGGFVVAIRPQAPPLSALTIDVVSAKDAPAKERPRVRLALARTPLAPLQKALGLPKGSEGIQAEGEVDLPLPSLESPAKVEGSMRLSVQGYVPPHPRELDGILFGDVTKVRADFALAPDFAEAKLSQVQVEAGALLLAGLGSVEREGFDANVSLTLKGSIPCTALATSVAVANLGQELGKLAGGLAAGALRGNVFVVLSVDAKASDIQNAKIDKSARVACKMSLPKLPTIILN
jgi:hypothetical protein